MTPTDPLRAVLVLHPDDPDDPADVVPDRSLTDGALALEARADALGRERFAVLARGRSAALGLAVAYVLPHRTEVLGLLAPEGPPPTGDVDAAGLTVPTLVWPGGDAPVWVAVVPGAQLQPEADDATQVLRRLLAAAV
ncbi:MAG TPA: hypothetical protein VF228_25085 [Iamia sp.]